MSTRCLALALLLLTGSAAAQQLSGSEWLLEDLAGSGVIDNAQATLAFPSSGKVSGNGSCNRFFGPVEIEASQMRLRPLGTTRMACPEAVMNQESKYLAALQAVERFERKDSFLLLYAKGLDKPLRFTAKSAHGSDSNGAGIDRLFGHIWRISDAGSKPAAGSIFIFLADGTLLETSCGEPYRIATWAADKSKPATLHVTENGEAVFTATIADGEGKTVTLKQHLTRSNETRDLTLEAVVGEFVCSDLPK